MPARPGDGTGVTRHLAGAVGETVSGERGRRFQGRSTLKACPFSADAVGERSVILGARARRKESGVATANMRNSNGRMAEIQPGALGKCASLRRVGRDDQRRAAQLQERPHHDFDGAALAKTLGRGKCISRQAMPQRGGIAAPGRAGSVVHGVPAVERMRSGHEPTPPYQPADAQHPDTAAHTVG